MRRKRTGGEANDQAKLIEYIKNSDRHHAWEAVKFIGYNDIKDINIRFLVFCKAFERFDPYINNNFIMFYKSALKYAGMSERESEAYKLTSNGNIINTLKIDFCSPKEDLPQIVEDLKEFFMKR
jgi:hypothetical protein